MAGFRLAPKAARARRSPWQRRRLFLSTPNVGRDSGDSWAWSDSAVGVMPSPVTVYADSGDGAVRKVTTGSTSGDWTTLRNASTGTTVNNAGSSYWLAYADDRSADADQYIFRSFMSFNLGGIPAGVTITSAELKVRGTTGGSSGAGGSVAPYAGSQASTTTLATSDYSAVGSSAYATGINFASWDTAGYNTFTLNSTGLAAFNAAIGSTVKVSFRSSFDATDTKPGNFTASGAFALASETADITSDPYVVLTYSFARTASDSWAWSDSADITAKSGNTVRTYSRTTADAWAWSDTATLSYLIRQGYETVLFEKGPIRTTLNGSVNFASLSTITVTSMPADAPTSGRVTIQSASGQRAWTVDYTGKSGSTLTGCTSWKTSGTVSSGTDIAWQNAEKNFPSIVNLPATASYPYGRLYATCTAHSGDDTDGTSDGTMIARYSDNGGVTWSTETVIASAVNSAYGIWGTTTAAYANGYLWVGWYEHNVDYNVVKAYSKYSTDGGVTFSSPVEIPGSVVSSGCTFICVGGGGLVDTSTQHLYLPVYVIDLADLPATTLPYPGYSAIIKSTDYGANWSLVSTIPTSDTASRGTTEPAILALDDGTWVCMLRLEVGSNPADTLDRYVLFSSDHGATWSGGTTAVSNLSNWCNVAQSHLGALVTQGQYEVIAQQGPRNYYSYDGGHTWPTYTLPGTDGTLEYYVGADQVSLTSPATGIASVRALQGTTAVPLSTAQTYFQWLAFPPYTADTWTWSDTATRTQTFARTTISNFFSGLPDTWTWSDAAVASSVPKERTTTDAWAWSDTATRPSGSVSRTTADSWTWSGASSASLGPISDDWAWADIATVSTSISGAAGQSGFWIQSVVGAEVVMDGVVDASLTFTAVV